MRGRDAVGIDVGGTSIKAVALDGAAAVLARRCVPTGPAHGVVERVARLADELRCELPEGAAIGVAVPGIVDERRGIALRSVNLGWRELPVAALLAQRLGTSVALGHDVRCGGYAEARLGAAIDAAGCAFVAVGTGVACALIVDRRPWRGRHDRAGEIGHWRLPGSEEPCRCGARGCVEAVASAGAIARRYEAATSAGASARRPGAAADARLDATAIWRRAASDAAAAAVCAEALDALAFAIAQLQLLLDLELVVIGGGLAQAGAPLLEGLRERLDARLEPEARPRLRPAALGPLAGAIGAALLAAEAR